jgi:hypothetical protein
MARIDMAQVDFQLPEHQCAGAELMNPWDCDACQETPFTIALSQSGVHPDEHNGIVLVEDRGDFFVKLATDEE